MSTMKRIVTLSVAAAAGVSFAAAFAAAQTSTTGNLVTVPMKTQGGGSAAVVQPQAPAASKPSPLVFELTTHDWGRIPDDRSVSHVFKFKNPSDRTVVIDRVTATCGCTVPDLQKKIYAPGESGEITATFNPAGRSGKQVKQINITYKDNEFPVTQLSLSSEVEPWVFMDQPKVYVAEHRQGTEAESTIRVTGRKPGFAVTEVKNQTGTRTSRSRSARRCETVGRRADARDAEREDDKKADRRSQLSAPDPHERRSQGRAAAVRHGGGRQFRRRRRRLIPQHAQLCSRATRGSTGGQEEFEIVSLEVDGPAEMNLVVDYRPSEDPAGAGYVLVLSGVTPSTPGRPADNIVRTGIPGEEPAKILFYATIPGNVVQPARVQTPLSVQPVTTPPTTTLNPGTGAK